MREKCFTGPPIGVPVKHFAAGLPVKHGIPVKHFCECSTGSECSTGNPIENSIEVPVKCLPECFAGNQIEPPSRHPKVSR